MFSIVVSSLKPLIMRLNSTLAFYPRLYDSSELLFERRIFNRCQLSFFNLKLYLVIIVQRNFLNIDTIIRNSNVRFYLGQYLGI